MEPQFQEHSDLSIKNHPHELLSREQKTPMDMIIGR